MSRYERGDVDRALAQADVVVEAEYRTQTVLHSSFETHQSVCEWRGDSLDVYISTQFIFGVRDEVAGKLGLPPDKVRVVCEFMGGGFGSKNGAGDYTFIAIELAKRTGRPVRCALTRREENLAAGNRNATIQRLTAAAKADGTLLALAGEFVNATGWDGWAAPTDGPMRLLYDCENVRTVLYPAKLNTPPMKAFRAPGFVEGTFGLECLLDELAAKLDLDSLELRRLNYANSSDDKPYSSKNLMECYRRAEQHWQRRDAGARAERGAVEARRRPREPDLVRRRRPALVRVGAARLRRARDGDHGDAGHRHRHGDGDEPDRGRGARASARQGRFRARRLRPRAVRVDLRRLVDDAVDGPGRAFGRRRRGAPGDRDRGAALRQGGARAVAVRAATSSPPTAARGRSRTSSGCSRTRRSSARARAARTRPGCRC